MVAVTINLDDLEQGVTYDHDFQWLEADGITPIDLTGCTARSEWRESIDSTGVLFSLTTENGRLRIDPILGKIAIHLTEPETKAFTFFAAVYDLEIVFPPLPNAEIPVVRFCKGKIKISREITRV